MTVNVAEMKTTSSYCDSVPNEQTCVEAMMSIQSCVNITRIMIACATSQTMMLVFFFFWAVCFFSWFLLCCEVSWLDAVFWVLGAC